MLKRTILALLAAALCLGASACKGEATQAELKAEKQRKFRARQKELAIKCYKDLVTKYPDSEFAAQAEQKLQQLGSSESPKK
jgi:uncharacterized protein HemX